MAYKNGYQVKVDLKKAKSSFGYVAWKAEDVKLKLKAKEEYVDTMLYDDCGSEYIIRECNDLLNIRNNKIFSMILYGKPGIGKTTIATAITEELGLRYRLLNAVINNKKDIKAI